MDGQHAVFEIREQAQSGTVTALLRDLNSSQGTYVNGARVQNASVRLAHGDRISFGHGILKHCILTVLSPHHNYLNA